MVAADQERENSGPTEAGLRWVVEKWRYCRDILKLEFIVLVMDAKRGGRRPKGEVAGCDHDIMS